MERVLATGVDRWIERQLHPEATPDPRLDAALAGLDIMNPTTDDLAEMFARLPKGLNENYAREPLELTR